MKRRAYTNLAQYLEKTGQSQQALADQLGVTQSHISRIVNGSAEPSLELALHIAELANVPIESLLPNANSTPRHVEDLHD
jgi:transcriptional regulator with XRE-family HTH domain